MHTLECHYFYYALKKFFALIFPQNGFGNLDSEYWLGLENIFWLANQDSYKLLILMEDWQGRQASAEYDHFRLEPESDFYRLRLGQYRGTAGDSLSWHNDKQFSTLDKDKDSYLGKLHSKD